MKKVFLASLVSTFAVCAQAASFQVECRPDTFETPPRAGATTVSYVIRVEEDKATQMHSAQLKEVSKFAYPPFRKEKVIADFEDTRESFVMSQNEFGIVWSNASIAAFDFGGSVRAEIEIDNKMNSNYVCE